MSKKAIGLIILLVGLCGQVAVADKPPDAESVAIMETTALYNVRVSSDNEAATLREIGAEALMRVRDGYLVLADENQERALAASGLSSLLLAENVSRRKLALGWLWIFVWTNRMSANIRWYTRMAICVFTGLIGSRRRRIALWGWPRSCRVISALNTGPRNRPINGW